MGYQGYGLSGVRLYHDTCRHLSGVAVTSSFILWIYYSVIISEACFGVRSVVCHFCLINLLCLTWVQHVPHWHNTYTIPSIAATCSSFVAVLAPNNYPYHDSNTCTRHGDDGTGAPCTSRHTQALTLDCASPLYHSLF